jgi:phospholipid transport system transporter-binding protein
MTQASAGGVEFVETSGNHFAVRGALTFATAPAASGAGLRSLSASAAGPIEIDLVGVEAADSAGLAVLLYWLAWARRNDRKLTFKGVPASIEALARISDVQELLANGAGGTKAPAT